MTAAALQRIEIVCDATACEVVGIAHCGSRLVLSPRLTPFTARDHASGHAEFYGCQVINPAPIEPTPVRVQKWGGK